MATKIRQSSLDTAIVTGLTELAEARADGDFVLVYDSSAGTLKKIQGSNLGIVGPKITSVSPTNALTGDGTGNHTFTITGTSFATGVAAKLKKADGTDVAFSTLTRNSSTQLTGVVAKSSLPGAGEPYDVVVTASQITVTLENQINIDQSPVFTTAAGSLGTLLNGQRTNTLEIVATDPESAGNVAFELQSGSLPAGTTGATLNENGVSKFRISGFSQVGSNTTSNFVLRAVDAASNTTSRAFAITVNAPVSQSFNSSGTFSVPSGVAAVDVLVVAGGGGGGGDGSSGATGGGGAGGLIFVPNFVTTPGGSVSVTVGGGASRCGTGQDSVFGTLTAKGGGQGGLQPQGQVGGGDGGSGGGSGRGDYGGCGGTGHQSTQSGQSGAYGFGNNGGNSLGQTGVAGGGGGGAGAAGNPSRYLGSAGWGGSGGIGKSFTIADGTTSVGYAGGGAGLGGAKVQGSPGAMPFGGGNIYCNTEYPSIGEAIGAANAGTANRGGGGAYHEDGGKGVVIVRY